MDIYEEQKLKISDSLLSLISEKKTLKDLTFKEFDEFLSDHLFETFIQNSMFTNTIRENKGSLFNSVYIHEELINELITIYQALLKKIETKDTSEYRSNDRIVIGSEDFSKYITKIKHVVVANNMNYIRGRVSNFHKSYLDEDKYSEAMNLAVGWFVKRLEDFDPSKWNIFKNTFLYMDSAIKSIFNDDCLIRYPKELYRIKKILDVLKDSDYSYSTYGYQELLFEIVWNLQNLSIKKIADIGELYFYILGYGSVAKNKFIETYYPKEFDQKSSVFVNEEGVQIFRENILDFIKQNNDPEYLVGRIRKIAKNLDDVDMGCDSLDREIGDDNDTVLLGDLVKNDGLSNFEILVYQNSHKDLMDREIRLTQTPNVHFNLLERIIAWTCINEYFTFEEFRNLLKEYGESKWVGDKYVQNFHTYLSLFKFKDKTDWYQYDKWQLDALIFEQMGDILWFSKEYAIKVYTGLKEKFDKFYKDHGIVFTKYDTSYHGKTKTFRDLWKIDNDPDDHKAEYVPPENFKKSYQALRKEPRVSM